jgi:hypothetical protein
MKKLLFIFIAFIGILCSCEKIADTTDPVEYFTYEVTSTGDALTPNINCGDLDYLVPTVSIGNVNTSNVGTYYEIADNITTKAKVTPPLNPTPRQKVTPPLNPTPR